MDRRIATGKRVGDFYEFYDGNAELIASALGFPMATRRGRNMVAIPWHVINSYERTLITKGVTMELIGAEAERRQIRWHQSSLFTITMMSS